MNILISPINWGIGHATRISPIIEILSEKHNIVIAADGDAYHFLKQNFPENKIIKAPTLKIHYSRFAFFMPIKILLSIPKLWIFYLRNKNWLNKYLKENKTDLIISDNRFGFFSEKIKSIIISHQIHIKTPKKLKIFENIIFKINKKNIEKFDEIWIPDDPGTNLSGELSSTKGIKIPHSSIGILSRFKEREKKIKSINYKIAVIISGPEPQRSLFSKKINSELFNFNQKTIIVEGKPKENYSYEINNLTFVSHLDSETLEKVLFNSEIIITRSGYSSIMDLMKIKKTAILIPTPGQTEQEYLANYLHDNNLFYTVKQKRFCLNNIVEFKKVQTDFQDNIKSKKLSIKLSEKISELIKTE